MEYKLSLTDADGAILNVWSVTLHASENQEAFNVLKTMSKTALIDEIVAEMVAAETE